jgi:tyrosyl-tRNA synthetase
VAYDGFEPSGRMHIAQVGHGTMDPHVEQRLVSGIATQRMSSTHVVPTQGVLKALNVNKLTRCGVTFKFW